MVISPFSRGGIVNSDLFDHTSMLRFLETRFGAEVPNLTAWRRKTVGDLSSALDPKRADPTVPALPSLTAQLARLNAECPDNQNEISLLAAPPALRVPERQRMPRQETR